MSQYSHKTWICPYYQWDEKTAVHCEQGTRIKFPSRNSANEYMNKFCCKDWKHCSIANSLNRFYETSEVTNFEQENN